MKYQTPELTALKAINAVRTHPIFKGHSTILERHGNEAVPPLTRTGDK